MKNNNINGGQFPQNQFGVLAEYYDLLNNSVNYKKVADYIESIFDLYNAKPEIILDLACGTGNLTLELDKRGYDMIGLDLSYEMLSVASSKKRKGGNCRNILWTNQDMSDFELYGTVDAVICSFDSLNYILEREDLEKCLKLVYNYLNCGGVFIFDINSKYKFEKIYGKNDFILENKNIFCAWRNNYNKKTGLCDFDMTIFINNSDGKYIRRDELQREKYYSGEMLFELLKTLDFTDINIFYDFDVNSVGNISEQEKYKENHEKERICFSCIKK